MPEDMTSVVNLHDLRGASMSVHCERNGLGETVLVALYRVSGVPYENSRRLPADVTVADVKAIIDPWVSYFVGLINDSNQTEEKEDL